jgi:hypothetical protein
MASSPGGPRPRGHERAVGISERAYRWLLRAYPRELRDDYDDEMARCFRDLCREGLEDGGRWGLAALWARTLPELFYTALKERSTMMNRNAYRTVLGVALAAAFLLAWMDLAVSTIEEPDGLAWMAPIGFFAVPVIGAVIAYKQTKTHGTAYRAAVGVALAVAFLLAWVNLAVGIIGSEDNPANLMYVGVLAVGIVGATIARFRPHGMARALFVTALAQALVAVIALIAGLGLPWSPPVEILGVNGFFVALFVGSGLLFRYAARERTPAGAGPAEG